MKLLPFVPCSEAQRGHQRQGVALVLVLSFLVIISGLIIAFFSMVTTEASSASTTAAATSAKSLADSAVSYVMGTIVDATLGRDPNDVSKAGPANAWVWASQPGMIRTFDNTGTPKYVYKLYSADEMKLNTVAPSATETASLSQWATGGNRDVWVDMNEPVRNALGDDVYPIVDPRAAEDYSETGFTGHEDSPKVPGGNSSAEINPGATGRRVSGFHVLKNGAASSTTDPNAPLYDANNNNPAPMPVKWLYVLQDGTLTTARLDGTNAALNGTAASATNPIRGRIAFWTDDESTKININTASEGTYWDVPRVSSSADAGYISSTTSGGALPPIGVTGLALCQPVYGEYQRYSGHPATTSLSAVFGFLGSGTAATLNPSLPVPTPAVGIPLNSNDMAKIEKYYNLTPRMLTGGSVGGTKVSFDTLPGTISPNQGNYWRLYSSVDELLFDATKAGSTDSDTVHRIPNVATITNGKKTGAITPDMAQKAKFFLTANSSAPEVTLYNTPRISMWPVNDTSKIAPYNSVKGFKLQRTPFDNLAAFCATVGPAPNPSQPSQLSTNVYYFSRWNARSMSAGGEGDYAGRNVALYKYLQALTSLPVPGNPGGSSSTFASKLGADRDQVLTSIFDYVRCTNMQDSTKNPDAAAAVSNPYPFRYTPVSIFNGTASGGGQPDTTPFPGAGEVIPIRIGSTQGFGRFDTIGSAYLVIFPAHGRLYTPVSGGTGYPINPNQLPPYIPAPPGHPDASGTDRGPIDALGVVFMVSFYNAMQGNVGNHPKTKIEVKNLDKLQFWTGPYEQVDPSKVTTPFPPQQLTGYLPTSGALGGGVNADGTVLPKGGINYIETNDVRTWHGRSIGGTASPVMAFSNGLFDGSGDYARYLNSKRCKKAGDVVQGNYPFYGYTIQFPTPPQSQIIPPAASFDKGLYYYWPTKFAIKHPAGGTQNDIIVSINTAPDTPTPYSPTGDGGAVETVQEIHLRFPQVGIFSLPRWASQNVPADGVPPSPTVDDQVFNDVPVPNSPPIPYYQKFNTFFYNNRFPSAAGGAGTNDFIRTKDVVVALEPAGINNQGAQITPTVDHTAGDQRMYAASALVNANQFQPDWRYGMGGIDDAELARTSKTSPAEKTPFIQMAHNMMRSVSGGGAPGNLWYNGVAGVNTGTGPGDNLGMFVKVSAYSRNPDVPRRVEYFVTRADAGPASWDTGVGMHKDGAYIGKPDEGDENFKRYDGGTQWRLPYYDKDDYFSNLGSFFSPNRQIPSSMVLGSIPTGIKRNQPWQTLLFHPPKISDSNPGLTSPPDHYLADLFWMPVVEPYAISQPFSTAGKINMNYQIQPFTYIHRNTGMRALMKSIKMLAITASVSPTYKPMFADNGKSTLQDMRYPLNMDATMTMFDKRFDIDHDVYRSATEISTIPLIPKDTAVGANASDTYASLASKMDTYWGISNSNSSLQTTHQLTGNNLRDKPYADLYGRLTTKSNAFTVHVRAQALRKAPNTDYGKWIAGKDQVVAEYRGSSIIERYIDANDPLLPDFATTTARDPSSSTLNIDQYYKFRTVSSKRFSP